jgi:hypothetical protein
MPVRNKMRRLSRIRITTKTSSIYQMLSHRVHKVDYRITVENQLTIH